MSVAATKTFTSQVSLFYLIALQLAQARKCMPDEEIAALLEEVHELPAKMTSFLPATTRSTRSRSATSTSRSSSSWGATSVSRCAWRAR